MHYIIRADVIDLNVVLYPNLNSTQDLAKVLKFVNFLTTQKESFKEYKVEAKYTLSQEV